MHFQDMDMGFPGLHSPLEFIDVCQMLPFLLFSLFLVNLGNPQHLPISLLGQKSLGKVCGLNHS